MIVIISLWRQLMKFFIFFIIVVLLFRFYIFYYKQHSIIDGQMLNFSTTLLTQPREKGRFQELSVILANGERVFIRANHFPLFHYGQTIYISGRVHKTITPEISNQNDQVLDRKRVALSMFLPQIEAQKKDQNNILAATYIVRQKTISLYRNTLPKTHASLLLGIVFGIKEDMSNEFMDKLRISGVLHVVAASGMNVTLVAAFVSNLFIVFFKRQYALILTLFVIAFYAVFSGLEASILRASIMGGLVFSAQIMGRQVLSWYIVLLTGWMMLLFWPYLLFDIGFQLSFAATLGILFLPKALPLRIEKFLINSPIGADILTTISAQLATIPILLVNFGTYSLISLVVNPLVLWVIPPLMVIGSFVGVIGLFIPIIGKFILFLSIPFLSYFIFITQFFGDIPIGIVIEKASVPIIIGYYCLLVSIVMGLKQIYAKKNIDR